MKQLHWPLIGLCSLILLIGCDEAEFIYLNKRETEPPKGQGATKEICTVIESAPFSITGRIQLKSRERTNFRLAKTKVRKFASKECYTVEIQSHFY